MGRGVSGAHVQHQAHVGVDLHPGRHTVYLPCRQVAEFQAQAMPAPTARRRQLEQGLALDDDDCATSRILNPSMPSHTVVPVRCAGISGRFETVAGEPVGDMIAGEPSISAGKRPLTRSIGQSHAVRDSKHAVCWPTGLRRTKQRRPAQYPARMCARSRLPRARVPPVRHIGGLLAAWIGGRGALLCGRAADSLPCVRASSLRRSDD